MTEQVIFTNPTHERTIAEYVSYSHKEAGFWMRFWAFLIDSMLVSAVIGIVVNPFFYLFDWDLRSTDWYAPIVIISAVVYYTYFILMTKFFAQTVGKMIFGLKVHTDSGKPLDWSTVIFREGVGRFLSNTFFKFPYLVVVFTPQHKAVHDFAADTIVIHETTFKETRNKRYVEEENEIATYDNVVAVTTSEQPEVLQERAVDVSQADTNQAEQQTPQQLSDEVHSSQQLQAPLEQSEKQEEQK